MAIFLILFQNGGRPPNGFVMSMSGLWTTRKEYLVVFINLKISLESIPVQ